MKRVFAGNLPAEATEQSLNEAFAAFGKVFSVKLAQDVFTGKCRGFGFIEMEGHEARAAIAGLNGKDFLGQPMRVNEEQNRDNKRTRGRRH